MLAEPPTPPAPQEGAPPAASREPTCSEDCAPEEVPLGAPQTVATFRSLRHFLFVVFINALVLAELCVAMYRAAQAPDEFTPVFFKTFFTLLAPTLALAVIGKRFVNPKAETP